MEFEQRHTVAPVFGSIRCQTVTALQARVRYRQRCWLVEAMPMLIDSGPLGRRPPLVAARRSHRAANRFARKYAPAALVCGNRRQFFPQIRASVSLSRRMPLAQCGFATASGIRHRLRGPGID